MPQLDGKPSTAPAAPTRLTVIGESLVDIITGQGTPVEVRPGGSPLNVAAACSRLGLPTTLITHYGADVHGQMINAQLAADGVTVINAGTAPTSRAIAFPDADGSSDYFFDIIWDMSVASIRAVAAIEDSAHVHAGSMAAVLAPGNEAVYSLLRGARDHATISYDTCRPAISPDVGRACREAEKFVRISDIVKASDKDLSWLYPDMTLEQVVKSWLKLGPSLVVVTRGTQCLVIATDGNVLRMPAKLTGVADTAGPGDAFMAALLAGLHHLDLLGPPARKQLGNLSSDTLRRLAVDANKASAATLSRPGANPPWSAEIAALKQLAG
ncbi:PfkB family carbohydrate kinase [Arthrobacter sp. ISL-5]|uniref:PfkB family carbohydrate kinase n=1 Tax=Arthrobacter sp. ISL-5 TaxID=2819111 RepID=UPI002035330F|nr:PfkB family carbohydrate kinase [Arthrobacter sp. ISL-5]